MTLSDMMSPLSKRTFLHFVFLFLLFSFSKNSSSKGIQIPKHTQRERGSSPWLYKGIRQPHIPSITKVYTGKQKLALLELLDYAIATSISRRKLTHNIRLLSVTPEEPRSRKSNRGNTTGGNCENTKDSLEKEAHREEGDLSNCKNGDKESLT